MKKSLVLATMILVMTVAARPSAAATPYYNSDDTRPEVLKYDERTLLATLQQELQRKRITTLKDLSGATLPTTEAVKLAREVKVALLYLLASTPGAEMDVLIESGGKLVPIESYLEEGTVSFRVGPARDAVYGKANTAEAIQKKYGTGEFLELGAKWDNDSLYVVETALSLLSPAELAGMAGLPFVRLPKDPSNKSVRGVAIAMYVPEKKQIELYDAGLEADRRRFFGSVDNPLPMTVGTLVHEAGHAIARAAVRQTRADIEIAKADYDAVNNKLIAEKKLYDADKATYQRTKDQALGKTLNDKAPMFKQLIADMNEKKKRFEALAQQLMIAERSGSAIEQAFDKVVPFRTAPTVYGRSAIGESFAESFALYKVDPTALTRAAPKATEWFASPAYKALLASK